MATDFAAPPKQDAGDILSILGTVLYLVGGIAGGVGAVAAGVVAAGYVFLSYNSKTYKWPADASKCRDCCTCRCCRG